MLIQAAVAAWRQVFSPPLRGILWRSLGLTAALLVVVWAALTKGVGAYLQGHPLSLDYPILDALVYFLSGFGLLVALAFAMPAVSALVAGFFLDQAAEVVERTDFPADPPGRPLPAGKALIYGLRFAGLALLVNMVALLLLFVPVVNAVAFFGANSYLFGREYFELAAARFRPMEEAAVMRRRHRGAAFAAGALISAVVLVPVLNLTTPLFGVALMVHLHKRLSRREPAA